MHHFATTQLRMSLFQSIYSYIKTCFSSSNLGIGLRIFCFWAISVKFKKNLFELLFNIYYFSSLLNFFDQNIWHSVLAVDLSIVLLLSDSYTITITFSAHFRKQVPFCCDSEVRKLRNKILKVLPVFVLHAVSSKEWIMLTKFHFLFIKHEKWCWNTSSTTGL